jgi:hypothetical protein
MLTIEEEKLLNDVHSRVLEYLNDIDIKPNKTEKEIRSDIDLTIGNNSDLNQIKVLFDKYLEHSTKTNSPQFYNQLFSGFSTNRLYRRAFSYNYE